MKNLKTEPSLPFTVVKALTETGFLNDSLMKAIACHESATIESLPFCLEALKTKRHSEWLENLRLGFLNANENPSLALNMVLKSLTEVVQQISFEVVEELQKTLLAPKGPGSLPRLDLIEVPLQIREFEVCEELRKGFLELEKKNEEQATNHFLKFVELQKKSSIIADFRKTLLKHPEFPWNQALSSGQIQSKTWLLKEWKHLNLPPSKIAFILGGWVGTLPWLTELTQISLAKKYRSFDLDPYCAPIAEAFNKTMVLNEWTFKATTEDLHDINYHIHDYETLRSNGSKVRLIEAPDLIINTSCEHIKNYQRWFEKIPANTLLILQSNNYFKEPTHINCSPSLEDFQATSPMSELLYAGEKTFPLYTRFMLMGRK